MNIQDVRLDIDKKTGVAQWVTIGQGDKGGTTIRATVFDNDVAAALTGMSARFEMRMPNATYFEDTNCTINGNVITYVVDESHAALYAGGESVAYFALYEGETAIYSTERFHVRVAKAASDGANPGHAWTNGIQEWLDDASDTLDDAVADANSRVGATINAANTAVEGMRSDVDGAISDTESVIDRAESAIDAMGDISELAVPEMSADVRGGAKLEQHGGLALRDGALGIGSLVQQSDGYARGGLAEVTAKGHAEQVSTTGKNLVFKTIQGCNIGPNGVISSDSNYSIHVAAIAKDATYTVTTRDSGFVYGFFTSEPTVGSASYNGERVIGSSFTFIVPIDGYIAFRSDSSYKESQLELGSTATEYEPYTGGAPSPSPDYPQEIQVVSGRNLLDASTKIDGYYINNQGVITVSTGGSCYYDQLIEVADGKDYTLSFFAASGVNNARRIHGYDSNGTWSSLILNSQISSSGMINRTVTIPDGVTRVRINLVSSDSQAQFTLGPTPQPYVPYGHVGMEVQGRNLLDTTTMDATRTANGITFTNHGDGTFSANGTATSNTTFILSSVDSVNRIVSGGGTFIMSLLNATYDTNTANISIHVVSPSSAWITPINMAVTVPEGATVSSCTLYVASGITVSLNHVGVQLELGTEVTPYHPYHHTTTPIPLPSRGWVAGLPDGTADSLRLDGAGKCEWEMPTSKVVFDGSEAWAIRNSGKLVGTTVPSNILPVESTRQVFNAYCTHFTAGSVADTWDGNQSVSTERASQTDRIRFADGSGSMTVESWVAWLAQNPVTVLYPLATPVTEHAGYVDMPAIPSDATVTIRELDDLGIKYFIDDSILVYGRQMYQRAHSEYADRLQALEEAVADLVTGA